MLIKNWMTNNPTTIDREERLDCAIEMMRDGRFRALPVTHKGNLCGIITDRDVKKASASDATALSVHEMLYLISKIKIKQIMTTDTITIPWDHTIEEAAEVMTRKKISSLPVVDLNERLAGIITLTDIARALIYITGYGKRGLALALLVEDRPGIIRELADIIRDHQGRIHSILSIHNGAAEGYRKIIFRIYQIDRNRLVQMYARLNEQSRLLYYVDHRLDERQLFE